MPPTARPLSPFLTIYRWPLAMALSIVHRITGVALAVGSLLVVWLLIALASGPENFATAHEFCGSWFGLILLFGWSWALCFHLANGIRHLVWDAGAGYSITQAKNSGIVVIVVSLLATGLIWFYVISFGTIAQGGAS